MATVALDTSVVVAALLSWHEQHPAALKALQGALAKGNTVIIPVGTLVESYAVLTRLPPPHKLSPEDALACLEGTFKGRAKVVGLDGPEAWSFLDGIVRRGIGGGRSFSAEIRACARKARANRFLTFNRRESDRA
ncbi:MAG: PIN domain-containing protein [Myxococcota bacterium]|jgi:predicted nucleic acid-binding protein|nr:PIN domain-containing protein [Myxococcota bacterium]